MIKETTTIPKSRGGISNRQGRIKIPSAMLKEDPLLVLSIFNELKFVPIDINSTVFDPYVEYRGISSSFTPVDPGSQTPFYNLNIVLRGYDENGVPRITSLEAPLSDDEYSSPLRLDNNEK